MVMDSQNSLLCTFMCCSLNGEIKISNRCVGFQNICFPPKQCKYKVAMYLFILNIVLQLSDIGNSITILAF